MIYKTSKDYKRLYDLLYVEKQDVFGSSIMDFDFTQNPELKDDPYYRRYECFRHNKYGEMLNVFGNPCFEKSLELFCSFCKENDVDFIDPDDYSGCVQPEPECRTQPALRPADGTQRRSVWHTPDEVPLEKRRIVILRDATYMRFRVMESVWSISSAGWAADVKAFHVHKWAYFDDLEAL